MLGHLFSPKASPTFLCNVEVLQEKKRQFMRFGMHHGLVHNEKCRANANDGVCVAAKSMARPLRRLKETRTLYRRDAPNEPQNETHIYIL